MGGGQGVVSSLLCFPLLPRLRVPPLVEASPPMGPSPTAAVGTLSSRDMAASPTSSRSITVMVNGSHSFFMIQGYSLARGMGVGKHIFSETFTVGDASGHKALRNYES